MEGNCNRPAAHEPAAEHDQQRDGTAQLQANHDDDGGGVVGQQALDQPEDHETSGNNAEPSQDQAARTEAVRRKAGYRRQQGKGTGNEERSNQEDAAEREMPLKRNDPYRQREEERRRGRGGHQARQQDHPPTMEDAGPAGDMRLS